MLPPSGQCMCTWNMWAVQIHLRVCSTRMYDFNADAQNNKLLDYMRPSASSCNCQMDWNISLSMFDFCSEEIRAQCLQPLALLNFHFITKSKEISFKVLLQWSIQMEIVRWKVWAEWWIDISSSVWGSCCWWHLGCTGHSLLVPGLEVTAEENTSDVMVW